MNIRSVDLNLLVILDALLDEAHVTRAALRLGLSQAAASNALDRCRHLFGDPLLERSGRSMRVTPRAEALRAELRTVIADIEAFLAPPSFDLARAQRTVRIITADIMSTLLILPMHRELARTAPGISLAFQPWQGADAAVEGLARGTSDLAISIFPPMSGDMSSRVVMEERYVVMMRADHPAASDFDLDQWLDWPHLIVSASGDTRGTLDDILNPLGRTRRVGMVVPSFSMVADVVAGSDLIALAPTRAMREVDWARLTVFEPPVPIAGFTLSLAWHRRRQEDRVVQHVASLVDNALSALPNTPLDWVGTPATSPTSARPR